MIYPKVKFSIISPKLEQELFYNFLFVDTWGWNRYIFKRHPQLKPILKLTDGKERRAVIKKYTAAFWSKNGKRLLAQKKIDEREWRKVEKKFMVALAQIMETSWPDDRKIISAMVTICPICPRFLNNWSFALFGCWQGKGVIEAMMHEICHFLYFKKWKEVFPSVQEKTFYSPYPEFHLSELLAPVILSDLRIQKILKKEPDFYEEHMEITIGKQIAPVYFEKLYQKRLENNTSFGDYLKAGYREIKKYKKLFNF